MATKNLTDKQRLFCLHYAACLNATRAARLAGYKGDGNTLSQVGFENLRKPNIKAYIDELLNDQAMGPKEVLARLSAHGRGDLADLIDPATGEFSVTYAQEQGLSHLIKKVEVTVTTYTNPDGGLEVTKKTKLEIYDAQSALVHLGKAHALFTDKHEVVDWKSKAIEDIRRGELTYDALASEFDESLAADLFRMAGVPIK